MAAFVLDLGVVTHWADVIVADFEDLYNDNGGKIG